MAWVLIRTSVESKARTYHGRGGSTRSTGGGGRARRGQVGLGGAGRVGAERDGAERGGAMRPEDNLPFRPPGHRKKYSWTFLWKFEQTKSFANRTEEHNERWTSGR